VTENLLPGSVSIVIPARDEEGRIGPTLDTLLRGSGTLGLGEIVVVVNGTRDDTVGVIEQEADGVAVPIRVLESPPGKGIAVRTGMLAATGPIRLYTDADLAVPVPDLARLARQVLRGRDVVIGSREAPGAARMGEPVTRHLVGRVFNLIVRTVALPGIRDSQCGAKAFTASAAESIFSASTSDGWAFDIEVLVLARLQGLQVAEIGVEWYYRAGSKVRPGVDAFAMLLGALDVRRRLGRPPAERR
jgi:dolichyl-phosphate beta-glucosyltransferase